MAGLARLCNTATATPRRAREHKEKQKMRTFWFRTLGLVLVTALLGVSTPSVGAQSATPTLVGNRSAVQAGQTIDFDGQGFVAGERLSVWATAANQVVLGQGFQSVKADGKVHFGYGVPGDAESGQWAITVFGEKSQVAVIAWFTVIGQAPGAAGVYAGVTPEIGTEGTTFTFFALNYDEKEKYSYWFTGPDGNVYDPHSQERRASQDGRVEFTWTAPPGLPKGRFVVTIQGVKSGVARAVVFELR
jgi:hypothetical protein